MSDRPGAGQHGGRLVPPRPARARPADVPRRRRRRPARRWRCSCWTRRCSTRPARPRRTVLYRCLRELDESLGGRLLVVRGDPADVGAADRRRRRRARTVHVAADFGPYGAQPRRGRREGPGRATGASWCAPGRRTRSRPAGCARPTATRSGCSPRSAGPGQRARLAARRPTPTPAPSTWLDPDEKRGGPRRARIPDDDRVDAELPAGRRGGRARRGGAEFLDDGVDRLQRGPQPSGQARHLPDVGAPQVRGDAPAHAAGRPRADPATASSTPTAPSWPGASSTPTSCGTAPTPPAATSTGASTPCPRTRARPPTPTSTRGARAAPASRSSTPGCGSCASWPGCTTGCA